MRPGIVFSAQALDGITFAMAVSALGIAGEANPIMAQLFGLFGLSGVLIIKFAGAGLVAWIAHRVRGGWWMVAAWIGVIGAASNVLAWGMA